MSAISPEAPTDVEPPEGLEQFPAFSEAVLDYEAEFDTYLSELDNLTVEAPPEGFVDTYDGTDSIDAANPHTAVAVFLLRHGAPVAITKETEHDEDTEEDYSWYRIWISPEIEDGYQRLWNEVFHQNARQLANSMTRTSIALDEALVKDFYITPIVNRHILWAHDQGILERAYVTSALHKYERHGANSHEIGSIGPEETKVIETLIPNHKPLALETVLGMGVADTIVALHKDPQLIEALELDGTALPSADAAKLELTKDQVVAAYDSYWAHLLQ